MSLRRIAASFIIAASILSIPALSQAQATPTPAVEAAQKFSVKITGSGPPVILIPGLSCGGDVWDGTVEHLKDRYECHVFTLAGFAGQPPMPAPFLATERDAIIEYIRAKNLRKPAIVGHSLGGTLAYWIAATAPDEVGAVLMVDGVAWLPILMNPSITPEAAKGMGLMMETQMASQGQQAFAQTNLTNLVGLITKEEDIVRVAAHSGRSDPATVGRALRELLENDLRPEGAKIKAPVLLLGAAKFAQTAGNFEVVAKAYESQVAAVPNHEVAMTQDSLHFIQLDAPEFFYGHLDAFLGAHMKAK